MASVKPDRNSQKTLRVPFPFLKKGSGLQKRKESNVNTRDVKKAISESTKRKANFSPKRDELMKKPLVDKTNGEPREENMANRKLASISAKRSSSMKHELENVIPGVKNLRPRGNVSVVVQPKPPPLGSKVIPNRRAKLPQTYVNKSAPPQLTKEPSETVKSELNYGGGPAAAVKKKETETIKDEGRPSLDSTKSDDNLLYVTALEECLSATTISEPTIAGPVTQKVAVASANKCDGKTNETVPDRLKEVEASTSVVVHSHLPTGVEDFDRETWDDPYQASCYAVDIFSYLKSREALFAVDGSYLTKQIGITAWMRSLLVDWMVEVQETFELNHETLYLAVKLVDLFLSRYQRAIPKEKLQLVGATAVLIACKFDERHLPTVEDFKLICDEAYTKSEILSMEMLILKVLDFNLGIPLSYRFLRRYARCTKASMQVLTLARYILESSLLEYSLITCSDSKMGAAALLLAMQMLHVGSWTPTLEYFSGYKLSDIKAGVYELNAMLHKESSDHLKTIKNKYSHRIFLEVALTPLLDDKDLDLKPVVECSFITEFEDHIFVTVDAEAFFFLHDLITSYVREKERVVLMSHNNSGLRSHSPDPESRRRGAAEMNMTSSGAPSHTSVDTAGLIVGSDDETKRKAFDPAEMFQKDWRTYICKTWHLEPTVRLLSCTGKSIEPYGVDYILQKLGFSHARTTIPKWMQRGFMDPLDKVLSVLVIRMVSMARGGDGKEEEGEDPPASRTSLERASVVAIRQRKGLRPKEKGASVLGKVK